MQSSNLQSSEDSRLFNIYLSTKDNPTGTHDADKHQKKFDRKTNSSQQYIIQRFEQMSKSYDELKQELAEKCMLCDSLMADNESMEKSITNLRGFVKNMAEMNRMNEKLKKKYAKFQSETKDLLVVNYNLIYKLAYDKLVMAGIMVILCALLCYFNCLTLRNASLMIFMEFTLMYITFSSFKQECSFIKSISAYPNIKNTKYQVLHQKNMPSIKEISEELHDAEKGNDFLNDLIELQ